MAYEVSIAGIDRTGDVINSSVVIEDVINDKANSCNLKLIDISLSGAPETDDEIIITLASGDIIFGGYITGVTLQNTGGVINYAINCVDYTYILDRHLAHRTFNGSTDADIINDLITTYCQGSGITTTNVIEGVTIDSIKFNYIQISQALRRISQLSGRNWFIDYEKDLHYFPLTTSTAPFNISTSAGQLVEDVETFTNADLQNSAAQYTGQVTIKDQDESEDGQIEYTAGSPFPVNSQAYAEFKSTGSNGGGWIYFYFGCSATPRSITQTAGGYLVVINEYDNQVDLYFNGTLITTQDVDTTLIDFDGGERRAYTVTKTQNLFEVVVDGNLLFSYEDIARTYGGLLYGIGGDNNLSAVTYSATSVYIYRMAELSTEYSNLKISKDTSQLKNRVYVRGGTKLSEFTTYTTVGDGEARIFNLPDKPHDISVTVNAVSKSVGIKNIDTTGYDWYLNFQEKYIEQDSGGVVLESSDTIAITYKYDIPILVALEDTPSINENGVKEFAIFDKSIDTTEAARDRAAAELTDYANDVIEGSFDTHVSGFRSGQYININLATYGVNDDYIVQRVVSRSIGAGLFKNTIYIASSKTLGIIRFLIELLEANKNLIELDDNEVVDELFNVEDSLLSDSLVDELTIDSQGAYFTWASDSLETTQTRMRWDLFSWA